MPQDEEFSQKPCGLKDQDYQSGLPRRFVCNANIFANYKIIAKFGHLTKWLQKNNWRKWDFCKNLAKVTPINKWLQNCCKK